MKAKELMIGDWIADKDGDKARVVNIIADEIDGCYYGIDVFCKNADGQHFSWTVPFEEAQPIPLTAEILDKNYEEVCRGKDGTSYEWCWRVETGYVEISESKDAYGVNRYWLTANDGECRLMLVRYVHELQHALRLCGVEKEIVL